MCWGYHPSIDPIPDRDFFSAEQIRPYAGKDNLNFFDGKLFLKKKLLEGSVGFWD